MVAGHYLSILPFRLTWRERDSLSVVTLVIMRSGGDVLLTGEGTFERGKGAGTRVGLVGVSEVSERMAPKSTSHVHDPLAGPEGRNWKHISRIRNFGNTQET